MIYLFIYFKSRICHVRHICIFYSQKSSSHQHKSSEWRLEAPNPQLSTSSSSSSRLKPLGRGTSRIIDFHGSLILRQQLLDLVCEVRTTMLSHYQRQMTKKSPHTSSVDDCSEMQRRISSVVSGSTEGERAMETSKGKRF